ncbi:hypothetical protein ATK30_1027 [Amycolatopsis echigonensis]|uniref:Uncharacterized protein n=1 Tax=Amycolatopsis echigonensis TaxID=2576905 RepID=A0A2N3W8T5_9PSEU|nr:MULTISPECIES: hypothetical protein [Amycolatopsis]PKV90283.1 hypothetical protein ATK30_1027 [Amycolatopsis niigatensis]
MLPGTALLPGWLGRTVVTLVTTYTRPGDRVLLLTPPPSPRALRRAVDGTRSATPYAGLAEAVWTVSRLGRGADAATAAPAPGYPAEHPDSAPCAGSESGSRLRLGRFGLHPVAEPHPDSARPRRRDGDRPHGGFDLIITALDPHATDWLAHTDWDALLTPGGLIAVVTHSDVRDGRLRDPHATALSTLGSRGLRCLDHIAVLATPVSTLPNRPVAAGRAGIAASTLDFSPRAVDAAAPPLRSVHHDLVLLGRLSPDATDEGAFDGKETSDV